MYEICREISFSAAHRLRGYAGKCAALHGHNWRVRLCARSQELDQLGMVLDFTKLKGALESAVARLDHCLLNEIPPFDQINPTAESIAAYIARETERSLSSDRVWIHRCEVWENDSAFATFFLPDR